ncbi:MAG: ComEC/Rec2 family competence protein, partial [Duncaniella sp.]|nr:ComEC/Rec2 family competence protein [Duncaniella sp.]
MNPRVSPLLPFASAFVCGILCADAGAGAWGLAVSAALGLAAMFARRSLAGSLLLGLALGIAASLAHPQAMMPEGTAGAADVWEGTAEAVREKGNATQLTVAVRARGGHPCPPFKAKVMAYGEALGDKAGWDMRFKGRMKPLENRSGIPLEPDPDKFLRLQGVTAVCHVTEDNLEVTGPGSGTRAAFSRLRTSTGRLIDDMGLRLATAEFLRAALLAEGHVIEPETRGLFGRAGIAHLLALSGIHVGGMTQILWVFCLPLTAAGVG